MIVISDGLPELLTTCHRILVMKEGRIAEDLPRGATSETDLAQSLAS